MGQIRLPCVDCGSTDFPKVVRRKRSKYTGKWIYSRSKRCIMCHRENEKIRYEQDKLHPTRYKNRLILNKESNERNKPKRKKYLRDYERKNAERIKARKHQYYLDNKEFILARNKKWKDANRNPKARTNKNHVWRGYERGRINEVIEKRKRIYDTTASATI